MPADIKPTQNIIRKAVFDILGQGIEGQDFLDLFAGSGAMGLDALSRGAKKVTFVEKNAKCADVIEGNISLLKPDGCEKDTGHSELFHSDGFAMIKIFFRQKRKFDIVYIDPPYSRGLAKKTLKILGAYDILQPNCVLIIEHRKNEALPESEGRFLLFRAKQYGATVISIYK